MQMGLPKVLTSDQGREFRNKLDKELMKLLGIKRYHTTPYHPQVCLFTSVMLCITLFIRLMV